MNKKDQSWVNDLETLVSQSTVAEATEKVMEKFEAALSALDPASQDLLRDFFDGTGVEKLSRERNISPEDTRAWLKRAKQELSSNLRTSFRMRQ